MLVDPNGEVWLQNRSGSFWWVPGDLSDEQIKTLGSKGITIVPDSAVMLVARGKGKEWEGRIGHGVRLNSDGSVNDFGPPKTAVTEIEFYGGRGEQFLRAYFDICSGERCLFLRRGGHKGG